MPSHKYAKVAMSSNLKEPLTPTAGDPEAPPSALPPTTSGGGGGGGGGADPLTPGPSKANSNPLYMGPITMRAPSDMIPASQLPETNDDSSDWESHPGKKGTFLGFGLVIVGMVASVLCMKYAPENVNSENWITDCPSGYESSCKSNSAVLRFSMALSIVFALQFIITNLSTRLYDSYWIGKVLIFTALCAGFFYADAKVFDQNGYAWFARIAGFFFVMLQQVILLDFALTWNSLLMEKADENGGVERGICGNKWLLLILLLALLLFGCSFSAIGVMFHYFHGCPDTDAILSITLITSLFCTFMQCVSSEGSILTSSIMTSYFTYIAFSAITLNPHKICNPTLAGSAQTLSAAIGMAITLLSLIWTTRTTIIKIPASLHIVENEPEDRKASRDSHVSGAQMSSPQLRSLLQEISVIFILISCYYAMVLTNWATLQANFSMASAKTGEAAMWLQASSIWVAALFYVWRLVAPKLFPDREF